MSKIEEFYKSLQRKTNITTFIPQIDGLRFVAIFMVVFFHINTFVVTKAPFAFTKSPYDFWWIWQAGFTDRKGVLLFFVISGFILGMPFAKHFWEQAPKVQMKKYFLRRLTRLEPPYIIVMILSFLGLMFYQGHDFAATFAHTSVGLFRNLAASLVYMHNILLPNTFSVNPVAWSLEIEVQFYILVPLLVLILKLPKLSRRFLLIFLIVFFIFIQNYYKPGFYSLYNYIQYFLLGFLLLDVYLSGWKVKISKVGSIVLGIACLVFMFYVDLRKYPLFEYAFVVLLFLFYYIVLTQDFWKKIFGLKLITIIGGMCYTIYLLHTSIISAIGNKTVYLNFTHSYPSYLLLQSVILLSVILLVSVCFYWVIERPCMDKDWPKKLWNFIRRRRLPASQ
jgi:peptidoglycan/LPS O-acetylase OafA/YrhL